jgi:hypothetical protein
MVTFYKGKIAKEDLNTGFSTFLRRNSLGGYDQLSEVIPKYYRQVSEFDDFETAISELGTVDTIFLVLNKEIGTHGVSSNVTVGSNIYIIPAGGILKPDAGVSITLNSPVHILGQTIQIIDTSGNTTNPLIFTNGGTVFTKWFGSIPDTDGTAANGTDNLVPFNCAIASFAAGSGGGFVDLEPGFYRISNYWNICNTLLVSTENITIRGGGGGRRTTRIYLDYNSATYALYYSTAAHTITIKNIDVFHTDTSAEGTDWHSATGIYINGIRFILDTCYVNAFTTGVYGTGTFSSKIINTKISDCQKGITLEGVNLQFDFIGGSINDSGDSGTPANGWGLKWIGGNGRICGMTLESSVSPGIIIEQGQGIEIEGNNFETFTTSRAIVIRGADSADYASIRNWSLGISIAGNRFWDALGIKIEDGVGWLNIDSNTWLNKEPIEDQLDGHAERCVNVSVSDKDHLRKINYTSRNHWLHDVSPVYHQTAQYAHIFTLDGKSWQSSLPSNGTFDVGDMIVNKTNPAFEWICSTAGTYGTLNGGSTTGTIVTATDDQLITLNSLTGIFPGARITIAGAGAAAANLDVIVGGVDIDNKKVHFYPAASTDVTDNAVSYTAPAFIFTGRDITENLITYAATITPDMSVGGNIVVTELTGDLEIANPTNLVVGQTFRVRLLCDGTGRNITYGTNFKANATSSITANKTAVLEFFVQADAAGKIFQINTPIEQ